MLAEYYIVEAVRGAVGDQTGQSDPIDFLARAEDGELGRESGNAGHLLEACRQYLLMIANDVIGPELQAKLGPSDLVQDTFLEAQRHIGAFRGRTRAELRAWLRKILECRLANVRRSYLATEKRDVMREVTLEMLMANPKATADALATSSLSPSGHAVRKEWARLLDEALVRLPENYRQAVAWRHREQLAWDEIGRRMGCSAGAARKLWSRAIHQLRCDLAGRGVVL